MLNGEFVLGLSPSAVLQVSNCAGFAVDSQDKATEFQTVASVFLTASACLSFHQDALRKRLACSLERLQASTAQSRRQVSIPRRQEPAQNRRSTNSVAITLHCPDVTGHNLTNWVSRALGTLVMAGVATPQTDPSFDSNPFWQAGGCFWHPPSRTLHPTFRGRRVGNLANCPTCPHHALLFQPQGSSRGGGGNRHST